MKQHFQTGSIEWSKNPAVAKENILRSIGDLFLEAGHSIVANAGNPDFPVPETFVIEKDVDGWDMRFLLHLNTCAPPSRSNSEDSK